MLSNDHNNMNIIEKIFNILDGFSLLERITSLIIFYLAITIAEGSYYVCICIQNVCFNALYVFVFKKYRIAMLYESVYIIDLFCYCVI